MRADVKLMIGVVGLGLLAAYALSKADPNREAPGEPPRPGDPPRPEGANLVMLGDPLSMKQNQYYRGRLQLMASLPPFSSASDEETLGKALVAMGFADVRVFMTVKDLPADWPQSTMLNPAPGTRWFQGMWLGPSVKLPRPPNVESMWMTRSPGLVASQAQKT